MRNGARFVSEEDVRQHVVGAWLRDHGFTADQIRVEYSFEIHLGRSSSTIGTGPPTVARPRADVLVRTSDGRNLLVVEVKAPGVPLGEDERLQAVSYARALETGIAPFAVVTNGSDTHVYDTASGERIDGDAVPTDHAHVRAGYRIQPDPALVAEALEALIGLSPETLVTFCRDQVAHRMQRLRSDDLHSGYKYVPLLYTARPAAEARLLKLSTGEAPVTLVVGPPQVGKTNLVCYAAERRLAEGLPTLFYPAVRMASGLLGEIADDFGWLLRDTAPPVHLVLSKLTGILRRTDQSVVIFVDGLNEADEPLVRALDQEAERLERLPIQLVVSITDLSAQRVLNDSAGNPAYLAQAARLQTTDEILSPHWRALQSEAAIVRLREFDQAESAAAYERYTRAFDVDVPPDHIRTRDPFLLRTAMEGAERDTLPLLLHGPRLVERGLRLKFRRMGGKTSPEAAEAMLRTLADASLEKGEALDLSEACRLWGISVREPLHRFEEAGLLMKTSRYTGLQRGRFGLSAREGLDFYSTRERDFAVAYWARDWPNSLSRNDDAAVTELRLALGSEIGRQALAWFLLQSENLDRLLSLCEWLAPSDAYDVVKGLLLLVSTGINEYPHAKHTNPLLLPLSDGEPPVVPDEDWGSLGHVWCVRFLDRVVVGAGGGQAALIDTPDLDLKLATLGFLRDAMPPPYASGITDDSDTLVRFLGLPSAAVADETLSRVGELTAELLYPEYVGGAWINAGNGLRPLDRIQGLPAGITDIALNGPVSARVGAWCVLGYLSQDALLVALSDAKAPVSPQSRAGVVAAIYSLLSSESWSWDAGEEPELDAWLETARYYAFIEDVCLPLAERFQVDTAGLWSLVGHVKDWLKDASIDFLGERATTDLDGDADFDLLVRYMDLSASFLDLDHRQPGLGIYFKAQYSGVKTDYLSEHHVVTSITEALQSNDPIAQEDAERLARDIVRSVLLRRARQNPDQFSLWTTEDQ